MRKKRHKDSIAEAYTMNESLIFCSLYIIGMETMFNRDEINDDRLPENEICSEFLMFR